jgi:starch-binding outer membrane protein, SusD/RagB family
MKKSILLLAAVMLATSCKESFLEQPPQDQITVDNFFRTPEQVSAATAALYGSPWFNFHDKPIYALGDMLGGNMHTYDGGFLPFLNFSVRQDNPRLSEAWSGLFKVVGFANAVINTLPGKAAGVEETVVKRAIGEARFMRALAYFYLVRIWGAVPIIANSETLATGDYKVPKNPAADVYKFITNDLLYAEANCPVSYGGQDKGRVTSGAAKTLLAKIYLYQKDYANARKKAEEVVASGAYTLLPDYAQLFKQKNNNNAESIFALQWVLCPDCWGQQNTHQAYFAPFGQGITETGDGWGSATPSIDLQRAYEQGDKRKKATIMTPGDFYPELTSKANPNGYTYPAERSKAPGATQASIRKHIVGSPTSPDGPVYFMRTGLNTNILRYAELLLIHAEAVLGSNASTADAAALASFNAVRQRAGLGPKQSITQDDILQERRIEMALEFDYWYDLTRIDRAKAIAMIAAQERGTYVNVTNVNSQKFTPTSAQFLMPIPQSESDRNPLLLQEPVPYKF